MLDQADYIKEGYFLEVSSTGVEKVLRKAREIENIHILIQNNGQDFNLSEDQIELAKIL